MGKVVLFLLVLQSRLDFFLRSCSEPGTTGFIINIPAQQMQINNCETDDLLTYLKLTAFFTKLDFLFKKNYLLASPYLKTVWIKGSSTNHYFLLLMRTGKKKKTKKETKVFSK